MIRKIRALKNVKELTVDFGNYVVTEIDKLRSARDYQFTSGEVCTCEQIVFKGGVLEHIGRGFELNLQKGAGFVMYPWSGLSIAAKRACDGMLTSGGRRQGG